MAGVPQSTNWHGVSQTANGEAGCRPKQSIKFSEPAHSPRGGHGPAVSVLDYSTKGNEIAKLQNTASPNWKTYSVIWLTTEPLQMVFLLNHPNYRAQVLFIPYSQKNNNCWESLMSLGFCQKQWKDINFNIHVYLLENLQQKRHAHWNTMETTSWWANAKIISWFHRMQIWSHTTDNARRLAW